MGLFGFDRARFTYSRASAFAGAAWSVFVFVRLVRIDDVSRDHMVKHRAGRW